MKKRSNPTGKKIDEQFKRKNNQPTKKSTVKPRVVEADDYLDVSDDLEAAEQTLASTMPTVIAPTTSYNVLDQLERAGFGTVVVKIRELQGKEMTAAITGTLERIEKVETRIDDILEGAGADMLDDVELGRIAKILEQLYIFKAKMLMIPMGAIHPRNMMPKVHVSVGGNVNVGNSFSTPGSAVVGRRK